MNWNIKRNFEKRIELSGRIKALEEERERRLDALPDSLTDEEYDSEYDRIFSDFSADILRLEKLERALEYPETRNEWFLSFVQSFPVGDSKLSPKQAAIFARYSEQIHEKRYGRGLDYCVRACGLFIETTVFPGYEGGYTHISKI